jgi:glycoside/pentoside/hexuronide:cation symporter, GPH family
MSVNPAAPPATAPEQAGEGPLRVPEPAVAQAADGAGPGLHAPGASGASGAPGTPSPLWAYGAFGAPLAWAALPLYVHWPAHAASHWGLPLAGVGLLLLAVRLLDAVLDPWIGRWADGWLARDVRRAWCAMAGGAAVLIAGLALLFLLPTPPWPWAIAGLALLLTSGGYSLAQITHQAWGARLGRGADAQARWVGARELAALGGVVAASLLPPLLGWATSLLVLALVAAPAWWLLWRVQPTVVAPAARFGGASAAVSFKPWQDAPLRSLMAVHALNGLASAVPATLLVFYVQDALQAPQSQGLLLAAYFVAAALAVPLWVKGVRAWGPVAAWGVAMALAIAVFGVVPWLQAGDVLWFGLVCVGTGVAAAGDAVAAQALLLSLPKHSNEGTTSSNDLSVGPPTGSSSGSAVGTATDTGAESHSDAGQRLGWWAMLSKLNLALAAGLALPLVVWAGYAPGDRTALSVAPLVWSYAALPCALKCVALAALFAMRRQWAVNGGQQQ